MAFSGTSFVAIGKVKETAASVDVDRLPIHYCGKLIMFDRTASFTGSFSESIAKSQNSSTSQLEQYRKPRVESIHKFVQSLIER